MIIQFVLSAGLLVCLVYAFLQKERSVFMSGAITLVSVVGCIFVWMPSLSSDIAGMLGVGRGADLILYCWVVLTLFIAFNLHLKLNAQTEAMTELVRAIALSNPQLPRD
jgi:hypothetical protein